MPAKRVPASRSPFPVAFFIGVVMIFVIIAGVGVGTGMQASTPTKALGDGEKVELSKARSTGGSGNKIELVFQSEYSGVDKILITGTPGYENCSAAVQGEAFDAAGKKVATIKTGAVKAHSGASASLNFEKSVKVKKVVGSIVPRSGGSYSKENCFGNLDMFKAKISANPHATTSLKLDQPQVFEKTGGGPNPIEMDFRETLGSPGVVWEFSYSHVNSIALTGTPGYNGCKAYVTADVFDTNGNKVATLQTPTVDAHTSGSVTKRVTDLIVRRVVAKAVGCFGNLDYISIIMSR